MSALLALVGLGFSLAGMVCNIIVLVHAFKKSVGTGFLCLCIPCYIIYYMFTEFEHENKNMIIAGALIGGGVGGLLNGIARNL